MRPGAGRPGVTPSSTHRRLCDTADDARADGRDACPVPRARAAGPAPGARDRALLSSEQPNKGIPPKQCSMVLTIGSVRHPSRHPSIRRVTQAAERGCRPKGNPGGSRRGPSRAEPADPLSAARRVACTAPGRQVQKPILPCQSAYPVKNHSPSPALPATCSTNMSEFKR